VAARPHHAPHLGDEPGHVRHEEHPEHADDGIERCRRKARLGGVAAFEPNLAEPLLLGAAAGLGQKRLGDVDTEHLAGGPDRPCGGERRSSCATAQVEHPLPGGEAQPSNCARSGTVPKAEGGLVEVVGRGGVGALRTLERAVLHAGRC